MKRTFAKILSIAGLAFATAGFAQEGAAPKSRDAGLGIRAAFDIGTMYGFDEEDDNVDGNPFGIGFEAGIAGRVELVENLYFAPEANFAYISTKQKYEASGEDNDRKYTSMELQIPLLLRGEIMDRFYFTGGPQLNLCLSSKVEQDYTSLDLGDDLTFGTPDEFKDDFEQGSFSFGIAAGAGVKIIDGLYFDFRFYMGLSQLFPDVAVMGKDITYIPGKDKQDGYWADSDGDKYTDGRSNMNMEGAKMMNFKFGITYWIL